MAALQVGDDGGARVGMTMELGKGRRRRGKKCQEEGRSHARAGTIGEIWDGSGLLDPT